MSNIKFEWDAKKASANEKKYGILLMKLGRFSSMSTPS
jgi:uncharacterized DUF497 family protein